MNTNNGALYFGAGINLQQWRRDIESMRRDILGLNQTVSQETKKMDTSFKNLSLGIAGYFSGQAIMGFIKQLIQVRGEFQKTEIAFATMLGDAMQAKVLMGQMVDLAAKTPFSLQDVSSGAKQLLAFQIPANQVVDTLTRMGNIAAGLGVPLSRINLVYGQVKAKGKLMGDDLRQFTEAGIPMVAELAKKFNKTTAEVQAMVSAGKVGFKDVKQVLFDMTSAGGMFFNLMEKQSASLSGKISNLEDAWDQMLNKIGESNEGMLNDAIEGLSYLVEHYEEVIKILKVLIATYGAYRAAVILTSIAQGSVVTPALIQGIGNLINLLRGATVAQSALNAATIANPYILLATAVVGLAVATMAYKDEIAALAKQYNELAEKIKYNDEVQKKYSASLKNGIAGTRQSISELIAVIKNENSSLEERKKAYEKLISIDASFRGTLDAQYRSTMKLADAFDFVIKKMQAFAIAQAETEVKKDFLKKNAEDEFNLALANVKNEEAARVLKEAGEKVAKGIITIKEYAKIAEPYREVAVNLLKAKNAAKESRKEVEYANKAEQEKLNILKKQEITLKAQLRGGKVQGKPITPELRRNLEQQLSIVQGSIKIKMGLDTPEEIEKEAEVVLGYIEKIEAKIDELREKQKKAPTASEASRIQGLIDAEQAKLDAIKKKNKDNKQLAEILPFGSPEQLQQQISLIDKAIATMENGMVKLRRLDKYGNDKDKKGRPLYTGEVITQEEATRRRDRIQELYDSSIFKTGPERLESARKMWENYYNTAEYYGKEAAQKQYSELFKGSQNYLQFIEQEINALEKRREAGEILTKNESAYLSSLKNEQNTLNGYETPFENWKRDIDNLLKTMPSVVEQLEAIEKAEDAAYKKSEGTNDRDFLQRKAYLEEQRRNSLQAQKDQYIEFEKEHRTFEQRKTEITQKYDDIRLKINKSNVSKAEKERQIEKANKAESKDISAMSWEMFQKTDAYVKAFGDLEKIGPRALKKIRDQFKAFLESDAGKALNPQELKLYNEALKNLDDQLSKNPFKSISISLRKYSEEKKKLADAEKKYGKGTEEYNSQLQTTNLALAGIFETAGVAVSGVIGFSSSLGQALGMLSEESQQTLKDIEQLVDGISNAVAGYFSGNYGQMAGGIVQMVVSLSSLLSGDNARERNIREWQRAVEELKTSYKELQRVIENTAGEKSLTNQRQLITNLAEQQQRLRSIREEEANKKKSDKDKVSSYEQQIRDIDMQIEDLIGNFKKSVTTVEFKELSQKIADAIVEGFAQGEDAAKSFDKVVDDVMRSAVKNALQIKILQPAMETFVDGLYSAMGYGKADTKGNEAIKNQVSILQKELSDTEDRIKYIANLDFNERQWLLKDLKELNNKKQELLMKIANLQSQFTSDPIGGAFDGLTPEEIAKLKEGPQAAVKEFADLWKAFQENMPSLNETMNGLKGDIKGITEKTAGALEGQINAMRIMQAESLKRQKDSMDILRNQLLTQVQIEQNTRPLKGIYDEIKSMNSKIKNGLAGIP